MLDLDMYTADLAAKLPANERAAIARIWDCKLCKRIGGCIYKGKQQRAPRAFNPAGLGQCSNLNQYPDKVHIFSKVNQKFYTLFVFTKSSGSAVYIHTEGPHPDWLYRRGDNVPTNLEAAKKRLRKYGRDLLVAANEDLEVTLVWPR